MVDVDRKGRERSEGRQLSVFTATGRSVVMSAKPDQSGRSLPPVLVFYACYLHVHPRTKGSTTVTFLVYLAEGEFDWHFLSRQPVETGEHAFETCEHGRVKSV